MTTTSAVSPAVSRASTMAERPSTTVSPTSARRDSLRSGAVGSGTVSARRRGSSSPSGTVTVTSVSSSAAKRTRRVWSSSPSRHTKPEARHHPRTSSRSTIAGLPGADQRLGLGQRGPAGAGAGELAAAVAVEGGQEGGQGRRGRAGGRFGAHHRGDDHRRGHGLRPAAQGEGETEGDGSGDADHDQPGEARLGGRGRGGAGAPEAGDEGVGDLGDGVGVDPGGDARDG